MSKHPLSFAQERLWFIDRLEPPGSLYNISRAFAVRGPLDRAALRRALDAVVARHDILRANIVEVDGGPVLAVSAPTTADVRVMEIGPDLGSREQIAERLAAEGARPFDLAADPLFRAALFVVDDMTHYLVVTVHHIVSDGWSMAVLYEELKQLYADFVEGRAVQLPPLPMQYTAFATRQRQWLQGDTLERLAGYWTGALAGAPPLLQLPSDRARPARQSYRGASLTTTLPAELTDALKAFSRRERVTLFMTMMAAFKVLLFRCSGQTDISVGTPIANRTDVATEPLIGFFANTLVLRSQLDATLTFREVLHRVRATSLDAFAHQDMPFDKLVELLRPQRSLDHSPLFQVVLALQNAPPDVLDLPGTAVEPVTLPASTSKFDVMLSLRERGPLLQGYWEYSADLFDRRTIERMGRQFEVLLRGVVADPAQRIDAVPLLDDDERARMLAVSIGAEVPYPRDAAVPDLFAAQVRRSPQAIAVVDHGRTVTYADLNARANRLAHHLGALGIGRGAVVGIAAERSIETLAGMLAILKAGGAYLPLDPTYPAERLAFMVQDAAVSVVLAAPAAAGGAPFGAATVVSLDPSNEALSDGRSEDPAPVAGGDDLAYVMYTSGSTGVPKGVAVPHRAITRLVLGTDYVRFQASDTVAHLSNLAFDAATFEVWGALLNGARLVVVETEELLAPSTFAGLLEEQRIDVTFLTVALFNQIAQAMPGAFRGVRDLLIGGELPDPRWVRAVAAAGRPHRILNAYGPTETTTFACCYEVPDVVPEGASIPIGRPIANTRAYVVDDTGQLTPEGVPGELWIGGDGVAVGYLARPDLTHERFVPDPFSRDPGARVYRSGDRVRRRSDGAIEFLGRTDHQVKLRGFRIELGEIEAVLKQHPGVADAVVLLHEDDAAGKRLIAYVEAGAAPVTKQALKSFLDGKVPAFEVPADFAILERLPRNPNGKVDRGALRDQVPAAAATGRVAPRDRVERALVEIWESTLQVGSVGVTDDFFSLGGHSLAAMRVFSRIEKVFGKRLPISALFEAPTVEMLAVRLRERLAAGTSCVVEIQKGVGGGVPLVFVHGIGGNVVGFRDVARLLGPEQTVYGIQARGLYDDHPPDTSIEEMAEHYVAAIGAVCPDRRLALCGLSFGGVVAFEMARQLDAQGSPVALLALLDAAALGAHRLLPRSARVRDVLSLLGRRIRYHATSLLLARDQPRSDYLAGRARTLRRRALSAAWRTAFRLRSALGRLPAVPAEPGVLPPRVHNVKESLMLAARRYRPQAYGGAATLFRARDTPAIFVRDPAMGWTGLVRSLAIVEVPGNHETLLLEPHVRGLARALGQSLNAVQERVQRVS